MIVTDLGKTKAVLFKSMREYAQYCKDNADKNDSSHGNDANFHASKDFDEAMNLAIKGWEPKRLSLLSDAIANNAEGIRIKRVRTDSAGSLSIDRYTTGQPKTLRNWKRKKEPSKRITLSIDVAENCSVDNEVFFNKAAMLMAVAKLCAKQNIQTQIIFIASVTGKWEDADSAYTVAWMFPVKQFNERLHPHKVGGAMHPATFRRLTLGAIENRGKSSAIPTFGDKPWGHGQSTNKGSRNGYLAMREVLNIESSYHIPSASDLELRNEDELARTVNRILGEVDKAL